jgi:LacI family transcriptional regulator
LVGLRSLGGGLLGRSIHGAIAAVRLQRVKTLLVETDLPIAAIAERTGFTHVEYLCAAFRRAFGLPPGSYRREHSQLG